MKLGVDKDTFKDHSSGSTSASKESLRGPSKINSIVEGRQIYQGMVFKPVKDMQNAFGSSI